MLFVVVSQNSIFLVGSRVPRAPLQDRSSQDGGLIGKLLDKCLQVFFFVGFWSRRMHDVEKIQKFIGIYGLCYRQKWSESYSMGPLIGCDHRSLETPGRKRKCPCAMRQAVIAAPSHSVLY